MLLMIPCMSIPEGVSSMFSLVLTRVTPACLRAKWMATSSARDRANRSSLWTMQ